MYSVYGNTPKVPPITLQLQLNELKVYFEVDTGCSVTLMTWSDYSKLWDNAKVPEKCCLKLKTYIGERLEVLASHENVFKKLGTFKGPPTKIDEKDATPRFFKPRPATYVMKPRVEAELDRQKRILLSQSSLLNSLRP
ncbi:hypothetical protein N1851_027217 [Merluccius polli]|uniref:Uncharacterized protein n=1 Tax=Merluccius polli TaxID=89951 RepID=A0AA47MAK4_MERPO|nr:hypothetical protein N1851_027217 [Merluccius polli]